MRKSRLAKLLAYIYIPVIFCIIGYLILGVALAPFWKMASDTFGLFAADAAPTFESSLTSIYEELSQEEKNVEIHTEMVPDDSAASSYQAIHIEDEDPDKVEEEVAQAIAQDPASVRERFIRLEEAQPADPADERQLINVYVRDGQDAETEERFGHFYVQETTEEGSDAPVRTALIYAGDLEPGSEEEAAVEPYHFILPQDMELSDLYMALVLNHTDGTKDVFHILSSEAAAALQEIFRRIQIVNVEASGSKVHEYIDSRDFDFPGFGVHYGELLCDRIELKSPVYWDDTNEILRYGAGQYAGSLPPGFGTLIVVSGHNNTFFAPLAKIEKNDIITFDTNYCEYKYRVTDIQILNEKVLQRHILDHIMDEDEEILILYTCYPFEATLGRKTDRLTVFAERISGYDVKWRETDE